MHLRSIRVSQQRLVLVLVEDLTAEKKRAVLNEKYRKLVHLLPHGIAEFSLPEPVPIEAPVDMALNVIAQGYLVDGNDEFAGIQGGSTVESLLGATLERLCAVRGQYRDLFRKWIKGGYGISSAEISSEHADANIRHMECTLIGIVRKGRLHGFWFLKRDITESRRMKDESFRAQKLESLGILAGGIAHDFNNSLTAILGNINLAKIRTAEEETVFQRLVEAERACGRAKSLTDQLLTFAKGGPTAKRVGAIAPLLKDSVDFALAGSNVGFEFSIPDDLWMVEFDEGQMNQVMSNLVINAQQAMSEGGFVSIEAENVVGAPDQIPAPAAEKYVKISVRDGGVGISPENLSRIFDPYFTTKETGTGLGLATTYAIVRGHGGCMTVESELAAGTTFHIFLPASDRPACPDSDAREAVPHGKGRVLVMEDERMVRNVACEMLRLIGYDVECVSDGREAIDAYKQAQENGNPFAAVIMNLTVPGAMGGKEAIGELLRIDPNTRAIVSSGYPHDPVMDRFRGYGFKGMVSKPYDMEELNGVLHTVITSEAP
jgi:two-component system, cell cycle sensor histidine kinase and response regulator CckA